ncbi:MAG: UbiA family prenyltransferase [bacterium]|nr:UbiA family prenyltransferase [bacterium]
MLAYLQLFRIGNALIAAIAVVICGWLVVPFWQSIELICAAIAAFFITAGANAANDANDVVADRINHPKRPLVTGKIQTKHARQLAFSFTIFGIGAGFLLPPPIFLLPILVVLLLWRYNSSWKRRAWIGNFTIALCGALTPILGAWVVGDVRAGILPALLVGFAFFARELAKDIQDLPGDLVAHYKTAVIQYGYQPVKSVIRFSVLGLLATLAALLTLEPFQNLMSQALIAFVIGIAINRYIMVSRLKTSEPEQWARVSGWFKEILILGLLVLSTGHIRG